MEICYPGFAMARISPSLEAFSETVEAIYDSALNPQHWRDTLRLIGERTHSSNVAIGTMDYDQKRLVNAVEHGYDPAFWKTYLENFGVNPLLIRSRQRPLGQVYTLASLGDLEEVRKSRFHNEWIRAQRFGDLIGLNGLRFGRRVAGLVVNRKDHQPPYGKHDLQVMRRLAPHVCRAFAVSDALELKTINARMLEATLDALACGVYLTDRQCRVVYMNAAAERHIKTGKTLRIVSSRLSPVSHAARELLAHTLARRSPTKPRHRPAEYHWPCRTATMRASWQPFFRSIAGNATAFPDRSRRRQQYLCKTPLSPRLILVQHSPNSMS